MTRSLTLGKPKTRPRPKLNSLLGLYELREAVETLVEDHARDLRELADDMRLRRAFRDGRWVVGVHAGGRMGTSGLFSRLDFELTVDALAGELRAETCATAHDRDLSGDGITVRWDDVGAVDVLASFIEASFLDFASRYFERP